MKLAYTVFPWLRRLNEDTNTWDKTSNDSKGDFALAVKAISFLGYDGVECFDEVVQIFCNDKQALENILNKYKIEFVCLYTQLTDDYDQDKIKIAKTLSFMDGFNIKLLNLQAPPRLDEKFCEAELIETVRKVKEVNELAQEYGITVCLHSHLNTTIETGEEIDRFAEEIDKTSIAFCMDTAHLELGGADVYEMFEKHIDKIKYVHYKDVMAQKLDNKFAMFCEPGRGIIDFKRISNLLVDSDYDGYICVEQDTPYICNFESAQKAIQTLKEFIWEKEVHKQTSSSL